jgi:hypothetical protein
MRVPDGQLWNRLDKPEFGKVGYGMTYLHPLVPKSLLSAGLCQFRMLSIKAITYR